MRFAGYKKARNQISSKRRGVKEKKHFLEQILYSDIHNKENGYLVRSLYFDTLDDRDFFEKESNFDIRDSGV